MCLYSWCVVGGACVCVGALGFHLNSNNIMFYFEILRLPFSYLYYSQHSLVWWSAWPLRYNFQALHSSFFLENLDLPTIVLKFHSGMKNDTYCLLVGLKSNTPRCTPYTRHHSLKLKTQNSRDVADRIASQQRRQRRCHHRLRLRLTACFSLNRIHPTTH